MAKKIETIKYDSNVKYGWDQKTNFYLNGNEFGIILNTFRTILSSPEAQKILLIQGANSAIEDVLKRNVESGIVKPVPKEEEAKALKPVPK